MTENKEHITVYKSDWLIDGKWTGKLYTLSISHEGDLPNLKYKEVNDLLDLFGVSGRMSIQQTGYGIPLINFTKETLQSFLECCKMQDITYRLLGEVL